MEDIKSIHVLLINYNIGSNFKKALTSLNYIFPRLNAVTVFNHNSLYLSILSSLLQFDV